MRDWCLSKPFRKKTDLINEYAKKRRPFPAQDAQSDAFRTPMQQHCCQDNIRCRCDAIPPLEEFAGAAVSANRKRRKIGMDTKTDVQYKRHNTVETDRTGSRAEARVRTNIPRGSQRTLFDVIVGGEDVSEHKPAPQGIEQAMTALRLTPSETLYVGDTTIDAETAARAGVAFLAVLSGVTELLSRHLSLIND